MFLARALMPIPVFTSGVVTGKSGPKSLFFGEKHAKKCAVPQKICIFFNLVYGFSTKNSCKNAFPCRKTIDFKN